jgi:hypothetical protein
MPYAPKLSLIFFNHAVYVSKTFFAVLPSVFSVITKGNFFTTLFLV